MCVFFPETRRVKWMNQKACKHEAYVPTFVEHVANVATHGIWIVPALLGALELIERAHTWPKLLSAIIYGTSLLLLFTVSTVFHSIHYCFHNGCVYLFLVNATYQRTFHWRNDISARGRMMYKMYYPIKPRWSGAIWNRRRWWLLYHIACARGSSWYGTSSHKRARPEYNGTRWRRLRAKIIHIRGARYSEAIVARFTPINCPRPFSFLSCTKLRRITHIYSSLYDGRLNAARV